MGPRRYRRGSRNSRRYSVALPFASMGPRRYRRGSPNCGSRRPCTKSSFNGAATLPSRIGCSGGAVNSPGRRCFNGAATLPSRIDEIDPTCPHANVELQWGRDVTVADRELRKRHVDSLRLLASMGPRRYRRGSVPRTRLPICRSRGFNGAATLPSRIARMMRDRYINWFITLQWGRDVTVADRVSASASLVCSIGFNGAATLPSRIA